MVVKRRDLVKTKKRDSEGFFGRLFGKIKF